MSQPMGRRRCSVPGDVSTRWNERKRHHVFAKLAQFTSTRSDTVNIVALGHNT
jgi:hypothetical protein